MYAAAYYASIGYGQLLVTDQEPRVRTLPLGLQLIDSVANMAENAKTGSLQANDTAVYLESNAKTITLQERDL